MSILARVAAMITLRAATKYSNLKKMQRHVEFPHISTIAFLHY